MAIKKTKEKPVIYNQIIVKAPTRKSYDVGEWRTALRAADNGRPQKLFDLYEDLLIDGILSDAIEKRILAITNSPITFQDANGVDVDEITDLIDTPAFEELLKTIMHVILWGRSGGEFSFADGFDFKPIPAKHISLETKSILLNAYDVSGINYEGDDHLLILGKKLNFGLLLKAAPLVIYKRGGFGDYAQWLELFGMPQRVGKYSSYDPESRKLLEEALENAGSAPYVVIPKESEVETVTNTGNGNSGTSYNDFRRACNEEILITLLGQTLTTVLSDTGARATAQVHKSVEEAKNKADMRMCQRVLNHFVVPLLEKRGYPVSGGRFVFPEAARELSVSEVVQLSDIIEIPASFLHDKYSIPRPDNGEPLARRNVEQAVTESPEQKPKKEKKLAGKPSKWERILRFFVKAPTLSVGAETSGTLLTENEFNLADLSAFDSDALIERVANGDAETFDIELFLWTAENLIKAFRKGWNHTSETLSDFDYATGFDAAKEVMEMNLFQFSAAKNIAQIHMLNQLFRETESFYEFKKRASLELKKWNENWLRTEYNTALSVAQQSETWYRLQEKTNVFPYWMYKTQDDSRVRYSHRQLNKIVLKADSHLWDSIYPPNDWRCRCYVVPRMEHEVSEKQIAEGKQKAGEYLNSPTYKRSAKTGWGRNRAKLKQVFTANQMYLKKYPRGAKIINKLDYTHWGLDSAKKLKENAEVNITRYTGTASAWWDNITKMEGDAVLTDYNGRRLKLLKKNFLRHTTGTRENRVEYLDALQETLRNPDEIWGSGTKAMDTKTLVKYFKDEIMVVICNVKQGQVGGSGIFEVKTWFPLAMKKQTIQKFRAGVLIKKHPQ